MNLYVLLINKKKIILQKFLTDLSASNKRIEDIDHAVKDFTKLGHSQLDMITERQHQIHKMWEHLNWLKSQKEKNLEGALRYKPIFTLNKKIF